MNLLIPAICYIFFSFAYYEIGFKIIKHLEDELSKIVFAYSMLLMYVPSSILILMFGEYIVENLLK